MRRLALALALAASGCGRGAEEWTHPDGLYALSFPGWTVSGPADRSTLFLAKPPRGERQCWGTVRVSPLTPCGSSQQCLNAAVADMTFEGSDETGFALSRREIAGVAVADTVFEKGGVYWRNAAFALPAPPGLALHEIHCAAVLPASDADKAALETILSTLKFGPGGR